MVTVRRRSELPAYWGSSVSRNTLRARFHAGLGSLLRRVARRARGQGSDTLPRCFDNNFWYEGILWEPTVRYALMDLLRPGDVAFDCGANVGGLTTIMSRLVGPRGYVCAFEASPRIIGKLQYNLVLQGCSNTTLYHRAVYSNSSSLLQFHFDPAHHHSDRVLTAGRGDTTVLSLALDDFIAETSLAPNLVKMDIEGAELEALRGFTKSLGAYSPHLILETNPSEPASYEFLRKLGYDCWDLASYAYISSPADFPPGSSVRNVAYVHSSKRDAVPYRKDMVRREIAVLDKSDFRAARDEYVSGPWIDLSPGRYHFAMNFDSRNTNDEMSCGIETQEKVLLTYQTSSHFLATSYRDWIIDIAAPARTRVFFRFLRNAYEPTFELNGGTIVRLDDLSARRPTTDSI